MRRILSILVIFLLVFTYSMPAYAEDLSNTTNSESVQAEDSENEENSEEEKLVEETDDEEGKNNEATSKTEDKDEEESDEENQKSPEVDEKNSNDDSSEADSSNIEEEPVDENNDASKDNEKDAGNNSNNSSNDQEGNQDQEVNIPDAVTPLGVNTSDNIIEEPIIPEFPESNIDVSPIFEGWVDNGDGTYKAYFGYENKSTDMDGNEMQVSILMGTNENKITGPADSSLFPSTFEYPHEVPGRPGRTNWFPDALVEIDDWDGSNIVWTLDGKTATASLNESLEHKVDVSPIFEGWVDNGDGTYNAYFGYENKSETANGDELDVTLPRGTSQNKVTGPAKINDFPEDFTYPHEISDRPGRTDYFPNALVEITGWEGDEIVWTLDGKTATASLNEGLEHKEEIEVSPIFEGWVDNGDGTYNAYFGYENKSIDPYGNELDVTLPRGTSQNKVTGPADINDFPENFTYPQEISGRPGRTNWFPDTPVKIDDWDGSKIVWTLDGKTATASLNEGLEKVYYEVTFNSNGGSSVPSQNVLEGETANKPDDPTRSGYLFTGWTIEGILYDFSTPVEYDITLMANWEIIPDEGNDEDTGGGGGTPEDDATIEAVTDNLSTVEGVAVSVETSELMANDIDADDFVSVQNPVNGSVSLSGTTVTFTPSTDFVGTGYFYYTVEDFTDQDEGLVVVDVEEATEIIPEETPLGGGNPNELLVIEPETVPLGAIDYSMPYVVGYPGDMFRPERQVTRGEMATIFARILQLDLSNPGEPMYSDVDPDDWYYKYVQGVSRVGLFGGYEGDMFKPNRPVTHAEIASAFSAYWDLRGLEVDSEGDFYTDISGHWAEEMINRLYNAGISVTYPDATFRPDTFTSRTELVVMVNRALNRAEEMEEEPSFVDVSPSFWGYGEIEAATSMEEESVKLEQ